MPATNFSGVASYGVPLAPGSVYDAFSGPALFVCNRSPLGSPYAQLARGDGTAADKPLPSIADALQKVGSDTTSGARIYVLEGHAENVTASNTFSGTDANGPNTGAQTIPAGCRIIGLGVGRARPTLTFTAAGSTIALAAANSGIENMVLLCPQTGTTTVAAMVTVTAAGCQVMNCTMQMASSATALATTGISLSSAASEFRTESCMAYGTTGTPTSWLSTTGTVGPARVAVRFCDVRLPLSATTGGCIDISANSVTAPVDWEVREGIFANNTANSTVAIKGVTGATGQLIGCGIGIKNATGAATAINPVGNWELIQCFATVPGKAGLIVGTVSG